MSALSERCRKNQLIDYPCVVIGQPVILLVDDFDDALDIYGSYLTHHGYRVVLARNGVEAVEIARRERPDLILLDLRMPILDGTGALRVLRADSTFRGVPIVALTANALDGERAAAFKAGFDSVISKPCLPDELLAAIVRLLDAGAADATSRSA